MDLAEARKKIQETKKPAENFIVINISYDCSLVLPYKDGAAIVAALSQAEQFDPSYSSKEHIVPLERSKITITTMSQQNYEYCKMAQLLGISYSDLVEMAKTSATLQNLENPP